VPLRWSCRPGSRAAQVVVSTGWSRRTGGRVAWVVVLLSWSRRLGGRAARVVNSPQAVVSPRSSNRSGVVVPSRHPSHPRATGPDHTNVGRGPSRPDGNDPIVHRGLSTVLKQRSDRSWRVVDRAQATIRSFMEGCRPRSSNDPIVHGGSSTALKQRSDRSWRVVDRAQATIRSFMEGCRPCSSNDPIVHGGLSTALKQRSDRSSRLVDMFAPTFG
jgi:hypothetical protein